MTLQDNDSILQEIESELAILGDKNPAESEFHSLRKLLSRRIEQLLEVDSTPMSVGDAIAAALRLTHMQAKRKIALLVIRTLAVPGAISVSDSPLIGRNIASLVEGALPEIAKVLALEAKRQTFEKLEAISSIHSKVMAELEIFSSSTSDPADLLSSQSNIIRALSTQLASTYLQPYGVSRLKDRANALLTKLKELVSTKDHTYSSKLVELKELITFELSERADRRDFLATEVAVPFFNKMLLAVERTEAASRERFECEIRPWRSARLAAEKRYPLHRLDRPIRVTVALENTGPGVAQDVRIELSSDGQRLAHDTELNLGNVPPGPFPLIFEVWPLEQIASEDMAVSIAWSAVGTADRREQLFDLRLDGQDPNIDWAELEAMQPYSTEVAEGSEFVGRKSKVLHLAANYLKQRMVSSFITGQKRVGKTSLAKAVVRHLQESSRSYELNFLYEEYGLYSRMDPLETVEALGKDLEQFLVSHLSSETPISPGNYLGSLAPLARIADQLAKEKPNSRFIVVLDEFDEIPPELYRFGPLAETFFSNLRALSAKRNLSFLLVGGERMPFVISAQGDQLNKFVRVALDYFDRVHEWQDYEELITKPVGYKLNWTPAALSALFELTNGHPYYTKLLCAKIYSTAVSERDTDVTVSEITEASYSLARELDTNAFAHIWKDGIQQEREQGEVIELKRRRFLCAVARTLREKKPLSPETVSVNRAGLKIDSGDIHPQFSDLVRRGFMSDRAGAHAFTIPLFALWLGEQGATQVLSDALADEYELNEQVAEDSAYVTQGELNALAARWHVYRGKTIAPETIRAWLDQVSTNRQRRLLFKLLQHLRFFSTGEIREKLKEAHAMLVQFLRPFLQTKRLDRRQDVLITYVDGVGKSGARFASLYAEENRIASRCVVSSEDLEARVEEHERTSGQTVSAIVLIDDFVGTGDSLSSNLQRFFDRNRTCLRDRNLRLFCVALSATKAGEEKVRATLKQLTANVTFECDIRVCELIGEDHFAFSSNRTMWSDEDEMTRAKTLCREIGLKLQKNAPLGYGDTGLLVVFPDTCPNNSLPILHSGEGKSGGWTPLFERAKN